jgi:5'/3'-nucleotidase SurE
MPNTISRLLRFTSFAAAALALVLCAGAAQAQPVEVLLTNDDGVDAPGLQAVYDALQSVSGINVTVVAPAGNASGTGYGFDTTFPGGVFHVDSATLLSDGVNTGYGISREDEDLTETTTQTVSASPADCIRWALNQLYPPEEHGAILVVSGSNRGQNYGKLGTLASGTVGGAGTARQLGVGRAIAVSQGLSISSSLIGVNPAEYTAGGQFIANLVQAIVNGDKSVKKLDKAMENGAFLNVNIPPNIGNAPPLVGALVTKALADRAIVTTYTESTTVDTTTDYTIDFDLSSLETLGPDAEAYSIKTDVGAVARSYISVQPIFVARSAKGGGKIDESLLTNVTP